VEEHDVAVGDDVIATFQAQSPLRPRLLQTAGPFEIFIADDLGPDESFGHVGVHGTGRIDGGRLQHNAAGGHFLFARREEGVPAHGPVHAADDVGPVEPLQAHLGHKRRAIVGGKARNLGLQRRAHRHDRHAARVLREVGGRRLGIAGDVFAHVQNDEARLLGQEGEAAEHRPLGVVLDGLVHGPLGLERRAATAEQLELALVGLAIGRRLLNLLFEALDPPQRHVQVRQEELAAQEIQVGLRIDAPARMRRRGVLERPQHQHHRVRPPQMLHDGRVLGRGIALARRQARQVDPFHADGRPFHGVVMLAEPIEPVVGDGHLGGIRVIGPRGVHGGIDDAFRRGVEDTGFPGQRQTRQHNVHRRPFSGGKPASDDCRASTTDRIRPMTRAKSSKSFADSACSAADII